MRVSLGIALLFLLALVPRTTSAASPHVVVSQIQVAGDKADDEFVELYNPSTHETSLDGWSLQYKSASGTKILKKNFSSGASIAARSYYLITNSGGSVPGADMSQGSFSMAFDGGVVALVSSTTLLADLTSSGNIVDKVGYGNSTIAERAPVPAPLAKQAVERRPGGTLDNDTDTDNNASDFFLVASHPRSRASAAVVDATPVVTETMPAADTTTSNTAKTQTTTSSASNDQTTSSTGTTQASTTLTTNTTPAPISGTVLLNEVLPDPAEGEREWVELYSTLGTALAIDGATLEDAQGTIATLSGSIGGDTRYRVAEIPATRLNNSGDAVILKWKDGTMLDRMTYGDENDGNLSDNAPAAPKNASLIRIPDGNRSGNDAIDWRVTATPTKAAANRLTQPSTTRATGSTLNSDAGTMVLLPLGAVRVNEWVSDPPDNGVEWVELMNTTKDPVSLAGWVIEEGGGEQTLLSGMLGTNEFDRYAVINNPKGNLNNGGDRIIVRDASKRIIDDVAYGSWANTTATNAPNAVDPWSVGRLLDASSGRTSKDYVITTTPTPNTANRITPLPSETSSRSAAAPLTPSPVATASASTKASVSSPVPDLAPTVILDASDEAFMKESVVFDGSDSFDPEGRPLTFTWEIEGVITKTDAPSRFEYRFANAGKFVLVLTVSDGVHKSKVRRHIKVLPPQTQDVMSAPEESSLDSGVQSQSTGTKSTKKGLVVLDGIVSAPFGILGARKFAAEPIGIMSVAHGNVPNLSVGTRVRVRGRRGSEQTETALFVRSVDDIAATGQNDPPPASSVAIGDLLETSVGHVVRITGEVEAARGKQVTVSEDGEQLALLLPEKTKLSASLFVESDVIAATGILRKTSSGFALVPRQAEDVQWSARAPAEPAANQPQQASGLTTALTTAALGSILYGLWKLVSRRKPVLITFPEAETKMLPEAPRPLYHDGTNPENSEESPKTDQHT